MKKRWYDQFDKNQEVFDKIQQLNAYATAEVARNLMDIACYIKSIKREQEELPVSIGVHRVMGLYQQGKNRRWYDQNPDLSSAIKAISTLSDDEYEGIIEALSESMK